MKVRKPFALAAWILFINTGVFGQEEFSKSDIIKHKIKSITYVDDTGRIRRVNNYDEHGNLTHTGVNTVAKVVTSKELVYNDHKLLITEKNFNPLGNLHFVHRFTYNSEKQLSKKEAIDPQDAVESTWTYEYDDDGNVIREKQISATLGNNETRYRYHKGKLVEEETVNETLGKEEKITFLYNERGLLAEQKIKSYFTNATTTLTFYYDNNGRLIRQNETTGTELDGETTYEYDEKGLLMKRVTKSVSDNLTDITYYRFEYY